MFSQCIWKNIKAGERKGGGKFSLLHIFSPTFFFLVGSERRLHENTSFEEFKNYQIA